MQRHSNRLAKRKRSRRGLTLLELILAVSLGLVLIAGIYAAIDQSARRVSIGRIEMERVQIARAVLRRFELDLRAAMFSVETAVSDGDSIGFGFSSDSESSSTSSSSETDGQWTGSLGIRGSDTEIWIDLSHIRRNIDFATVDVNATSDLKTVAYFLDDSSRSIEVDQNAPFVLRDDDGIGLARSEGDRSVLRSLNPTGGILPGTVQILAPEIDRLQFRYFDGLEWFETWDSALAGMLPRAVEVTIGFEAPEDRSGYMGNSTVSASTETFRLVVAIPVSDPLSAEE
jgi:prepilin-type N-terminal cleavage/methylation domain-containing protein